MVMHFSVDDFINTLLALREENYDSIFDQPTFAMLRRVHEECGAVFSCYCFYESDKGNLKEVPDKFAEEFQANADWLRFGFHSYNTNSNYGSTKFKDGNWIDDGITAAGHYDMVIAQLIRITGGEKCIDRFPRIHYYAGTVTDCKAWKEAENGIQGLITAEDDRVCYYHDEAQWAELIEKGFCHEEKLGLGFYRTNIRLENMRDMDMLNEALNKMDTTKDYLVFTHEKFLVEKRIEEYFFRCGQVAEEMGMQMGYFYENKRDMEC